MAAKNADSHDVESIKYIGIAKVRRVLEKEWKTAGVQNQEDVQWDVLNGWTVTGNRLTPDAIRALEEDDGMVLFRKDKDKEEPTEE